MRISSFIAFIFCFNPLFSQNFLDTLAQKNWITTIPFNYNGERVDPFMISDSLDDLYSEYQLDSLTRNHVSPSFKFYSFIALYHRNYTGLFDLLKESLSFHDYVRVNPSLMGGDYMRINDVLLNVFSGKYFGDNRLDLLNKRELDSILLFREGISLDAKSNLLLNYSPSDSLYYNTSLENQYCRIKDIVERNETSSSIIALARFKRKEDVKYIADRLKSKYIWVKYYAVIASQELQDTLLFEGLMEIHKELINGDECSPDLIRELYISLVQYPTVETKKRFLVALNKKGQCKKVHRMYIQEAISKYPNEVFKDIVSDLSSPPARRSFKLRRIQAGSM